MVTATGIHPPGTITFVDNGMLYGPITPGADGVAHGAIGAFGPGIFNFQAIGTPSNPSFAPSTSMVIYVDPSEMGPAAPTTTLTLTASPSTQVTNQPITLTVSLGSTTTSGSSTTPGPVPPGDVTLLESGVILSVLQPDTTGLATYTIPHPTPGSHTYTASYAGTPTYSAALASTSVSITAPITTTLSAHPDSNPVAQGQAVACIATVAAASGPAPTGVVTFTDGATPLGSVPLSSPGGQGIVTLNLGPLSIGLHTITVAFQPDPGFSPSAGTCTVNVGGAATATTLTSSRNPAATTDSVLYTITVTNAGTTPANAAPSGSVTLSEGSTLLASAPLVAGPSASSLATLPVTLSAAGLHLLTATYTPATAATFTSSATLSESITAPPPITTLLSATPNPATIGQPVTLSATATSAAALPSPATVTFTDGATVLGSAALSPSGTATLSVSTLSLGAHPLSALLRAANPTAILSSSPPLNLQVNGLGATLSLAVAPSPSALATSPVTLTAAVVPTSALPSGFALSGTVTFLDGTLVLGAASLPANGSATFTTSTLATGSHSLSASFSGNTFLAAASSAPVMEGISPNLTSTSLTVTPAVSAAFAPVILSANVTSTTSATRVNTPACPPACAPITVTFFADTPTGRSALGGVPIDANGNASLTVAPPAGSYSLFAAFSGSTLFGGSSSAASPLTIAPAPTALTLSANPNPVFQHGSVTLIAPLTAPGVPASALAGTVTFLEGSTTLGSATLAAAQHFAYIPGSVGPHTLTAVFSGSASLSGSSSTTTVTVLPSDFVLSLKSPSLTIATTHHAPVTLSINTTGSLADLIDLSCRNLPQFASCSFSPATQDLTATNTSIGSLMLDTDALLNYARLTAPPAAPGQHPGPSGALTALLALCVPPTLFAAVTRVRRRRHSRPQRVTLPRLLAMLLASVAAITLSGCSGLLPPHAAPGTYTVTITGHARSTGVEHSTTLTLVVTP